MRCFLIATSFVLLLLPTITTAESLNFWLHQTKKECFYDDKVAGQSIEASFMLNDPSEKIGFVLFGPDDNNVIKKGIFSELDIREKAEKTGMNLKEMISDKLIGVYKDIKINFVLLWCLH